MEFHADLRHSFVLSLLLGALIGPSLQIALVQAASVFHTDPPATITIVSPELVVLRKELGGYPNYGVKDGRADILYSTESDLWTFDLTTVTLPGPMQSARIVVSLILDDHYNRPEADYIGRVAVNSTQLFAGGWATDFSIPHGTPFGLIFQNWKIVGFDVPPPPPSVFTVHLDNQTAGIVFGDWIAIDFIEVQLHFGHITNQLPVAHAGPNQTKNEGSSVTLDGTGSQDPDGDVLSYAWTQVDGPPVQISDPTSPTPTFTTPFVNPGGATLVFELVVSDGELDSEPDEVQITVLNVNDPPACDLAQASPALLWPPNHKLVPVAIVGVSDPDHDQVTLTVTAVTQDEPVNGLGDGDTSPDAVLQGGSVLLRAERAGGGNGRVYEIHFSGLDAIGGRCTGSVKVCVPHDRSSGGCVDDGQGYDAAARS